MKDNKPSLPQPGDPYPYVEWDESRPVFKLESLPLPIVMVDFQFPPSALVDFIASRVELPNPDHIVENK